MKNVAFFQNLTPKKGFLAPIGLKIWDQAFLDLEIQKTESARPDSFQKPCFCIFLTSFLPKTSSGPKMHFFFRVTRRAYDRWKGLDEIYNLRLFFWVILFIFFSKTFPPNFHPTFCFCFLILILISILIFTKGW